MKLSLTVYTYNLSTWTPNPLTPEDIPIMELAVEHYNKKGSSMINCCRVYLQVISIFDLLLFEKNEIHPAYLVGLQPDSCTSTILWPPLPRPPKRYWGLWGSFLRNYIIPLMDRVPNGWKFSNIPRFTSFYFKHHHTPHLYRFQDGDLARFWIMRKQRGYSFPL